ncbi:hypothetical protein AA0313_2357 [Acetobacter indonesiensis NRIC 0313]|uniref:Uncharacterized protein n=1 Tax=Acetobacter indonesiensis TaxID=104101 RepID=A0A6N3T3Z8_9PROT|nr:hypothetical protein Abin_006_291 [Acetobacter indonesiensis]GBQ60324.1 hypothetical protein AA0313_2357 [Acetobacter indonesiensis NRIC 0313]GEN02269.1 hypothetical protein AIN02nite_02940 [Acetobacter indonesiensis]
MEADNSVSSSLIFNRMMNEFGTKKKTKREISILLIQTLNYVGFSFLKSVFDVS